MSWTIETINYKAYAGSDPQPGFVTGYADTASDLPTIADLQGARVDPLPGSAFTTCDDGKTYLLDSSGTWHVKAGEIYSNVYTEAEVDTIIAALDAPSVGGMGKYIERISETDGVITATAGTLDTAPASGSAAPITSGAVYTAMDDFTTQYVIGYIFEESTPYDLNDYKTPGIWRSRSGAITANIAHVPAEIQTPNTTRGFRLEVSYLSSSLYIRQLLIPAWNANLPDKYYIRHYRDSGSPPQQGWSNWYEYAGTDTGS